MIGLRYTMSQSTRYVVFRDNDDKAEMIGRIITDAAGLWGEAFLEGHWIRNDDVVQTLFSPGYGDIISYEEAKKIAREMGMAIE